MTLTNPSEQPVILVGLSTPVAGRTMLMHTQRARMTNGREMLGMVHAERLTVPARGSLVLGPTGDHLMLLNLKRPLKVSETLPITLLTLTGQRVTVSAQVQKR